MTIVVHIRDSRWEQALPSCAGVVRKACRETLGSGLQASGFGVTIILASDAFIRKLNRDFRGKDKPTNVLSFPEAHSPKPGSYLGDIILARQTIAREAKEQGKTIKAHVAHLVVHGVLHLLGHDHIRNKDAETMEALEIKILKKLGISNPYL